jgi:hypothetical protein
MASASAIAMASASASASAIAIASYRRPTAQCVACVFLYAPIACACVKMKERVHLSLPDWN